jgi:hypothetical protein
MYEERTCGGLTDVLARELNDELVRRYGTVLSASVLAKTLGYRSASAYRQAIARGAVPVNLFSMPNRRGRFALARDVAEFLCRVRRGEPANVSPVSQAKDAHEDATNDVHAVDST